MEMLKNNNSKKKKQQKKPAKYLVSTTAFRGNLDCLRAALKDMAGWGEELRSDARRLERCCIMWIGKDVDQMRFGGAMDLRMLTRRGQYASRIDGMREIACKDATVECVERLRALFPDDPKLFAFSPRSWRLPLEGRAFERTLKRNKRKNSKAAKETYIIKPAAGSEGNGIFLAQSLNDVPAGVLTDFSYNRKGFVAQEYIAKPMTLDGFKFDLRMYALVTSVDPLRCYLFEEGLVRLCSEPYRPPAKDNLRDAYAHLTNYSLNKKNHEKYQHTFTAAARLHEGDEGKGGDEEEEEQKQEEGKDADFDGEGKSENEEEKEGCGGHYEPVPDGAGGSKRKLSDVLPVLEAQSGGAFSSEVFWEKTTDLVAKTLIAYQPTLAIAYRHSFPRSRQGAQQQQQQPSCADPHREAAKLAAKPAPRRARAPSPEVGDDDADEDDQDEDEDDDEKEEEEGDDSFRCFHILGFDVLLSDQAGVSAHLLEVNSNPSLGITHDIEPEDQEAHVLDLAHATGTAGWGRARPVSTAVASRKAIQVPSPIDEEIKTSVVRDTLRLVMASGQQQQQQQRRRPRQEQGQEVQQQQQQQQRQRQRQRQQHGRYAIAADGEATQFLPVVTAATEAGYSPLMVFDRVRRAFEACAGGASALQRHGGCLTSGDFRRAAAALGVRNADADIAFVKLVRSASSAQDGGFNNRTMELPTFVDGLEVLARHPNATPALRFAAAGCFGGEEREQGRRGRGEGGGGAGQDQNQQCRRRCVIETAAELIIAALCR